MSLLWKFPGRVGMARILVAAAVASLVGFLVGGLHTAGQYAGVTFAVLFVAAWAWTTTSMYTA